MKTNLKHLVAGAAVAVAGLAFGAANDTIVAFSTKGPDTYKDGVTVVRDGEKYALVWTPEGAAFGGFAADGSLVSAADRLVVVAALAKGGRCPEAFVQIPADEMEGYRGGTFALYLLDTRAAEADAPAVNASGEVAKMGASAAGGTLSGGAVALAEVGVYTEIREPKITGLAVGEATITLTVEGLEPTADYFVVSGAAPSLFEPKPAAPQKPVGNTLTVEKRPGAAFFKVVGARKFE